MTAILFSVKNFKFFLVAENEIIIKASFKIAHLSKNAGSLTLNHPLFLALELRCELLPEFALGFRLVDPPHF